MSRTFVPDDQTISSSVTVHTGNPSDSDTDLPTPTPLEDRAIGKVIVTINGVIATFADADPGVGNTAFATGWIEWLDPGVGWVVIDTIGSNASNGGSDSDSTSGPYLVDMSKINNLADIEGSIRCRTSGSSSNDAAASAGASISSWSIEANIHSGGILAA